MSFVTTVCGGAAGSAAPPEPCPHSGAATTEATATVAHQRAQCVIPTSVEGCGGVTPPPPPRTQGKHSAPRPRLITAPPPSATPPGRGGGGRGAPPRPSG